MMRWEGRRQSENVTDRRGVTGGIAAGGGFLGITGLVLYLLLGGDPGGPVDESPDPRTAPGVSRGVNPNEDQLKQFTSVVLADTEDVWHALFAQQFSRNYREPKLVLFSGSDRSGCGFASSATGPFYCPRDEQVYIDLQFFNELAGRFQAAGDFAQAYVIAHEVGHHVQKQLGVFNQVDARRRGASEVESNRLSVRTELQADFLAGVWAHHAQKTRNILEPGDLEEALAAANAVGDERLQRKAQGHVVPDSFTHGTSAQRVRWFQLGFQTGDLSRMMDTFKLSYSEL
jgi:predicted metalloprotease